MRDFIRLRKQHNASIREGFPWVYASDLVESSAHLLIPPGSIVDIRDAHDRYVATGYYNHHSVIAARILTRDAHAPIDTAFLVQLLTKALARRTKRFSSPYYRVVHAEADGLPGLILDRFGDLLVCQQSTAGMEALSEALLEALHSVFRPRSILFRNDHPSRTKEQLPLYVRTDGEAIPDTVPVYENDCMYFAHLKEGQKTGWFFDQRENRAYMASHCQAKTVLDVYSHSGGFGLLAAQKGATHVTMTDRSPLALALAKDAADAQKLENCSYIRGDAFDIMDALYNEGKRYDIVIADPPAFVKHKKDIASGMKGYRKVAYHAARLVEKEGLLYVASCSHHANRAAFVRAVKEGIRDAGLTMKVIKEMGAGPDHPVHPKLSQGEYLKSVVFKGE